MIRVQIRSRITIDLYGKSAGTLFFYLQLLIVVLWAIAAMPKPGPPVTQLFLHLPDVTRLLIQCPFGCIPFVPILVGFLLCVVHAPHPHKRLILKRLVLILWVARRLGRNVILKTFSLHCGGHPESQRFERATRPTTFAHHL